MKRINELQDIDSEDNQRYSRATAYENAEHLRKRGLLGNITDNIIAGNSVRGSFKRGISDTFKAKATGLKERLDPINIAKSLTGNLGASIVGSLLNRSPEDIAYFAGKDLPKRERGKLGKINTAFYATVVRAQRIRKGDSFTDVATKLFAFMKKTNEEKTLQFELAKDFEKEEHDKDKERHEELIKAIKTTKQLPEKLEEKLEKEKEVAKVASATKMLSKATQRVGQSLSSSVSGVIFGAGAASAASVIAQEEGLPSGGKAMIDQGHTAIGYGHNITEQEQRQGFVVAGDEKIPLVGNRGLGTVITKEQATKLLQTDLPKYEKAAREPLGESWNKLSEEQKAALTSYAYNTGSTQTLVNAGLKEAIDSGDMKAAARIISEKGVKTGQKEGYLPSLDRRRHEEAALFESGSKVKEVDTPPKVGDKINKSSVENQKLKEKTTNNTVIVNNSVTSISGGTTNKQIMTTPAKDIPPTYMAQP